MDDAREGHDQGRQGDEPESARVPRRRTPARSVGVRPMVLPFLVLTAVAVSLRVLGVAFDSGSHLADAFRAPDPGVGVQVLGTAGQVVSQVLGVAISVVAIIVELAANRYTHRIAEQFFRAPVNFAVMGLFVIASLEPIWVAFTYTDRHAPGFATALAMVLMSVSVLLLLPYFSLVAAFVNPVNVIERIRLQTLGGIPRGAAGGDMESAQHGAADGAEQLSDVALNAMVNHDKAIAMAAVNAIGDLLRDYGEAKASAPREWFKLGTSVRENPDFVSLASEALGEIGSSRTWYEFKLLRQYEMIYRAALNESRELNYLISSNVRELAVQSIARGDDATVELSVKFFNTFLRATLNARDVRTGYNVLNQYRLFAEHALRTGNGRLAISVARYFKYYGLLAFHQSLGFILETAAFDLCALNELAFDLGSPIRAELLRIFLQVDKEGEGEKMEAALRGVRKAQVKLATYYLARGDESAAREVYRDMADEQPVRLASIRDEMLAVDSPHFWEVTDRGMNFDWISPERKRELVRFFGWFGVAIPPLAAASLPGPPDMATRAHASLSSDPVPRMTPERGAAE